MIFILILGLVATGCSQQADKKQDISEGSTQEEIKTDKTIDFNKMSEEEKAELRQEREALEIQRKTELGEFYVPLPTLGQSQETVKTKAKALYLTANVAGFSFDEEDISYYGEYIKSISGESDKPIDISRLDEINKLEKALAICESTEINALVIDIKNDDGAIAWQSNIEVVNQIKSNQSAPLKNYEKLMKYLNQNNIYSIARVVAFKDPYLAERKNEHAIQLKSGEVYKDKSGKIWVNSFDEYVWKYVIAISQEATLRGFNEIQYDYVRFPDSAVYYNPITEFHGRNGRDKDEGIEEFLKYADKALEPYNVNISADVFGVITRSWDDYPEDIGQTWRMIANQVDYICPMIYPSHYGLGIYGFDIPDQHPYDVARFALMEGLERNAAQKNPGIIRPWFQGFTAGWVKGHLTYDAKAISDQLVASAELGIDEYIIWNAKNNYDPMSFFYQDGIDASKRKSGEDILSRTPEMALKKYLDSDKKERYSQVYLLTPMANREDDFDLFASEKKDRTQKLIGYNVLSIDKREDGTYGAKVNVSYNSDISAETAKEVQFEIILENDVYKVIEPTN